MVMAMAIQVRNGVGSRKIRKLNPAARRGAVARAVTTTVIEVSTAAKLKASVLPPLATTMMIGGQLNNCGNCLTAARPSSSSQSTKTLQPISRPRQNVRPQPSRPDSRISSVSGVMSIAPANAMARPCNGRMRDRITDKVGMVGIGALLIATSATPQLQGKLTGR